MLCGLQAPTRAPCVSGLTCPGHPPGRANALFALKIGRASPLAKGFRGFSANDLCLPSARLRLYRCANRPFHAPRLSDSTKSATEDGSGRRAKAPTLQIARRARMRGLVTHVNFKMRKVVWHLCALCGESVSARAMSPLKEFNSANSKFRGVQKR